MHSNIQVKLIRSIEFLRKQVGSQGRRLPSAPALQNRRGCIVSPTTYSCLGACAVVRNNVLTTWASCLGMNIPAGTVRVLFRGLHIGRLHASYKELCLAIEGAVQQMCSEGVFWAAASTWVM